MEGATQSWKLGPGHCTYIQHWDSSVADNPSPLTNYVSHDEGEGDDFVIVSVESVPGATGATKEVEDADAAEKQNSCTVHVAVSPAVDKTSSRFSWGIDTAHKMSSKRSEDAAACHVDYGVLRAVPARKALQSFADVMNGAGGSATSYNLSQATQIIHSFWSHSWRANSWFKRCTLMLFYNGNAAAISSIAAACLAVILMQHRLLPGSFCMSTGCESHGDCPNETYCDRHARCMAIEFCLRYPAETSIDATCPDHDGHIKSHLFYHWPFVFAAITYLFVLIFWQARSLVFLDKACIHQTDAEKKRRGIDSLGGFLRCSTEMIILWDATYFDRLWCTFELAAYTHLKRDEAKIPFVPVVRGIATFTVLVITTIYYSFQISPLGMSQPLMLMGLNAVLLCVLAIAGAHIGRAYARDRQTMKEQLTNFRISSANCTCCSLGHVDPVTKQAIECDRPVVEGAVESWFSGGLQEFDEHVQTGLFRRVMKKMPGLMGYTELLYASLPVVWFELSKVGGDCATFELVVRRLVLMLGDWLAVNPFAAVLLMCMTNLVRTRRTDWRCDWLITAGIAAAWAVIYGGLSRLVMTTFDIHAGEWYGGLIVCALFLPVTILLLRFPATRFRCGR